MTKKYKSNKCDLREKIHMVLIQMVIVLIPDYKCNNLNIDYDDLNINSRRNFIRGAVIKPDLEAVIDDDRRQCM